MQPTLVPRPIHHEGWVYEEKVDGYRMVAYKADRSVKLVSRQGVDHTSRYPDIVAALRALEVPTFNPRRGNRRLRPEVDLAVRVAASATAYSRHECGLSVLDPSHWADYPRATCLTVPAPAPWEAPACSVLPAEGAQASGRRARLPIRPETGHRHPPKNI